MTLEEIRINMINMQELGAFIGLAEDDYDFNILSEEDLGDYETWLEDEFFMVYPKQDLLDVMDVVLEDDDTENGGTSFSGETVADFVSEVNGDDIPSVHDLESLNKALKECGISTVDRFTREKGEN